MAVPTTRPTDLIGDDGAVTSTLPHDRWDVSRMTVEVAVPEEQWDLSFGPAPYVDAIAPSARQLAQGNLLHDVADLLHRISDADTCTTGRPTGKRWENLLFSRNQTHLMFRFALVDLLHRIDQLHELALLAPFADSQSNAVLTHLACPTDTLLDSPQRAFYRSTPTVKFLFDAGSDDDKAALAGMWRDRIVHTQPWDRPRAEFHDLESNTWTWWDYDIARVCWPLFWDVDVPDAWDVRDPEWGTLPSMRRPADCIPWMAVGLGPEQAKEWDMLLDRLVPGNKSRDGVARYSGAPPADRYFSAARAARLGIDRGWTPAKVSRFLTRTGKDRALRSFLHVTDPMPRIEALAAFTDAGHNVGTAEEWVNCGFVGPDAPARVAPFTDAGIPADAVAEWALDAPSSDANGTMSVAGIEHNHDGDDPYFGASVEELVGWEQRIGDLGPDAADRGDPRRAARYAPHFGVDHDHPLADDLLRSLPDHLMAVAAREVGQWPADVLRYLAAFAEHQDLFVRESYRVDYDLVRAALGECVERGDDPDAVRAVLALSQNTAGSAADVLLGFAAAA